MKYIKKLELSDEVFTEKEKKNQKKHMKKVMTTTIKLKKNRLFKTEISIFFFYLYNYNYPYDTIFFHSCFFLDTHPHLPYNHN